MLVTITFGVESRDGDHAVDEFAATASYAERKLNLEHRWVTRSWKTVSVALV